MPLDPNYRVYYHDGTYIDLYNSMAKLAAECERIEPGVTTWLFRFIDEGAKKYELGMDFVARNYDHITDLANPQAAALLIETGPYLNLFAQAERYQRALRRGVRFAIPRLLPVLSFSAAQRGARYPGPLLRRPGHLSGHRHADGDALCAAASRAARKGADVMPQSLSGHEVRKSGAEMAQARLVLVTGATGYIGGRLAPRLLQAGHRVRCLVRDPGRLQGRPWLEQVELVTGDVLHPETLPDAMDGVSAAYYLIHSMASGQGFHERDLTAAHQFGLAAAAARVERIIYLGGLGDPQAELSQHLRSRQQTGAALREAGVPVTEFRAGVIVGSGSLSFELIRYLIERLPMLVCPRWLYTCIQPIGIRNVLEYLIAALDTPESYGRNHRDRWRRCADLRRYDVGLCQGARVEAPTAPRAHSDAPPLFVLGAPAHTDTRPDCATPNRRIAQRGCRA